MIEIGVGVGTANRYTNGIAVVAVAVVAVVAVAVVAVAAEELILPLFWSCRLDASVRFPLYWCWCAKVINWIGWCSGMDKRQHYRRLTDIHIEREKRR